MSVERIETKGRYLGAIIGETETIESKKEIMKNKSKLKHSRNHSKVYIENDIPLETRNVQNTVRTVLREVGKDKDNIFSGNRLVPKQT